MSKTVLYTTYLACAIEHATNASSKGWKPDFVNEFVPSELGIYDPIKFEALKTGKTAVETSNYLNGVKRSGNWKQFHETMKQIWWGTLRPKYSKVSILENLRNRASIDRNSLSDFVNWADYEAVVRSDFIVAYLERDVKTFGTICEIHTAYLFNIPVYLILPDQTKTEANSTLIHMVIESGGEVFYATSECVKFIKSKYDLT